MRPAEPWIEAHPVTRTPDPVAELDIFNRGAAEAFVEAADLPEHTRPDGAEPSPERSRFRVAELMDAGVGQVLVLRHEIGLGRLQIVGPEDGAHIWLALEDPAQAGQRIRRRDHVCINKDQQITRGPGRCPVARDRRTRRPCDFDDLG